MYNHNLLEAEIVKSGLSKNDIAMKIGISISTLYRKLQEGTFDIIECQQLVDLLKIENPSDIFFGKNVT